MAKTSFLFTHRNFIHVSIKFFLLPENGIEMNVYCVTMSTTSKTDEKEHTETHKHTHTHRSVWNSMSKACVLIVKIVYLNDTAVMAPLLAVMRNKI